MQNWEPGDYLYLFGFSRGAYTVRVLAAMLHLFGLLPRDNEQLIPYMLRSLKRMNKAGEEPAGSFKQAFSLGYRGFRGLDHRPVHGSLFHEQSGYPYRAPRSFHRRRALLLPPKPLA